MCQDTPLLCHLANTCLRRSPKQSVLVVSEFRELPVLCNQFLCAYPPKRSKPSAAASDTRLPGQIWLTLSI